MNHVKWFYCFRTKTVFMQIFNLYQRALAAILHSATFGQVAWYDATTKLQAHSIRRFCGNDIHRVFCGVNDSLTHNFYQQTLRKWNWIFSSWRRKITKYHFFSAVEMVMMENSLKMQHNWTGAANEKRGKLKNCIKSAALRSRCVFVIIAQFPPGNRWHRSNQIPFRGIPRISTQQNSTSQNHFFGIQLLIYISYAAKWLNWNGTNLIKEIKTKSAVSGENVLCVCSILRLVFPSLFKNLIFSPPWWVAANEGE